MSRLHRRLCHLCRHLCELSNAPQTPEDTGSTESRPTLFPKAYVSDWWQATKRAAQKHMSLQELLCFQRGDANHFGMLGCFRGLTMATNKPRVVSGVLQRHARVLQPQIAH